MTRTRLVLTIIIVLVLVALGVGMVLTYMSYKAPIKDNTVVSVSTGTTTGMSFEIADTDAKQELGLGNRGSIPDNYGMLFVFKIPGRYGFWMKDMLIPIDITWLSDNGTIVLIDKSVEPSTYPHAFYPPTPVSYVIETRAGYANEHGWEVGTRIPLPPPYGS